MTVSGAFKVHSEQGKSLPLGKRPLLWLNVLCLDAPLVAVSWQLLFARSFQIKVHATECAALFLTAWAIYLMDRFADSIVLKPGADRSARVDFCLRHQKRRAVVLLVVCLTDGAIIITGLAPEIVFSGMILGGVALLYLIINYFFSRLWRTFPVKEVAIGFLFAAGTVLVLWTRAGHARLSLLFPAILFGCLCSLNCLSIAVWERELDGQQNKHSFATDRPGVGLFVVLLAVVLATVCFVTSGLNPMTRSVTTCLGMSAILLLGLHFIRINRDERTALADLVLLTPLIFLFL